MTDSPRWCGICKNYGDHHTDRHEEMSDRHIHECDCIPDDRCEFCGCCRHCGDSCRSLCKVASAPSWVTCPDSMCGCAGAS